MVRFKIPPSGYKSDEWPLVHSFSYRFALSLEAAASDATQIIILRGSKENAVAPELIEVNPANTLFEECDGPLCHAKSIIPRVSLTIDAFVTPTAATDVGGAGVPILFNWLPIYTAFENQLDADDLNSTLTTMDILELTKDANFDAVHPLFAGKLTNTSLWGQNFPLTTSPPNITDESVDDVGLTTNALPEHVAFNTATYFNHIKFGENSGMLRKMAPRMNTGKASQERPYHFFSNNFTFPTVKRINKFTYCGIIFSLPAADSSRQNFVASEVTAIEHLFFRVNVNYDEWNMNFDQGAQ